MKYLIAEVGHGSNGPLPDNKRVPFGWQAAAAGGSPDSAVRLSWPHAATRTHAGAESVRLRVTAALDVREELLLEAVTVNSRRSIGVFDIRYASALQPFEIPLLPEQLEAVLGEGVELRMTGGSRSFWILEPDAAVRDQASLLFPHLLMEERDSKLGDSEKRATASDAESPGAERMLGLLASLSSLQPFGWLEGCVLDGLTDLGRALGNPRFEDAARAHLDFFQDEHQVLKYEDPLSVPSDGKVYGIEGTLPFAAWARLQPDHPALEQAISLWASHRREDGAVCGEGMLSAEGSYTVAYPMAVLARVLRDPELAETAIRQLEVRRELLTLPNGDLYLRCYTDGSRTFRHWARAHAWYLLGLVRTLAELREAGYSGPGTERCAAEFVRAASVAQAYQSRDGLWPVFIDEPLTGSDTSGSAGIAAALALGAKAFLLPESSRTAAERAWQALLPHLTPDGILGHVAQSNKGGEALQRSGYRTMFQMATGLMGQLYAALQR